MDIQPIHTEKDYELALAKIEQLMDIDTTNAEDELDMLATLVEVYEAKHFAIPAAHPLAAIRFVMEQNGLIAKDLMQFIGSSGRVSEVLSGQRPLSISMIRNLNKGLKIPAEILIKEYKVA
jgi:HTH-type transcriptional regulator/antitoxin HigA